ncbi:MAG: glucosamine-6-phosphate deaminase [Verrucomicrobiae bacterium]|nr:glucosamine-6-phosphate deaminase [Verrucomicrobiae bacterium]
MEPLACSAQEQQFEKIPTLIFPTPGDACAALAAEIRQLIESKAAKGETTVLGLATGSTPVPFYRELIRLHREEGLSFETVITFNLDEYHGLSRDHPESYYRFMHEQLFDHINLKPENIHVPDGTIHRDEVFEYCAGYEQAIEDAGGLDMQILGIGRTGHIGFNEPGSARDSRTRLITLDRLTRIDAAADFQGEQNVPRFAITMGVGTILAARRVALLAWGENKADIVAQAVEGEQTDAVSASFLQGHSASRFIINKAAASALKRVRLPWLTGSVTWTPDLTRRAVTWLAFKTGKPFLKLVDEEYSEHGMADLLTEHGSAYDLNIKIFNDIQHTITGWPGGKPDADDSNRPERSEPSPKRAVIFSPEPQDDVLAMGGTMERLVKQGHRVLVAYQTSGDLRVSDAETQKFSTALFEISDQSPHDWKDQLGYAQNILSQLEEKGPFGEPSPELRQLKGLIRRGDARNACEACSIRADQIEFLDLPFYKKGRYRQFTLSDEDVDSVVAVLDKMKPHQIFATGHLADPSSVQGVAFEAVRRALIKLQDTDWMKDCYVWLYRGQQRELAPHEIDMAVPMSPGQLATKLNAIQKFQSHSNSELVDGSRNRDIAVLYDKLGLAEYEAIEAFERYLPESM